MLFVTFVVRIISQLVQELNNRTFNDKASYKAVLSDAMLEAASVVTCLGWTWCPAVKQ